MAIDHKFDARRLFFDEGLYLTHLGDDGRGGSGGRGFEKARYIDVSGGECCRSLDQIVIHAVGQREQLYKQC